MTVSQFRGSFQCSSNLAALYRRIQSVWCLQSLIRQSPWATTSYFRVLWDPTEVPHTHHWGFRFVACLFQAGTVYPSRASAFQLSYVLQLGYQIVFLRSLLVPPFVLINLLEVRNQMGLFGNYPISVPSSPAKCPYLQNEGRNVE